MKKIVFHLLIITAFFLTGCFETTEDVAINPNGSGTYTVDIDMSGMFSMMDMMKAADTATVAGKGEETKNIDSTIAFKTFTDTSTTLSAEEKALLRNAVVHMKMNESDKVFTIKMTYPFTKVADVVKLVALSTSDNGNNVLKKVLSGNRETSEDELQEAGSGMPDYKELYVMTYRDGLLERKIKNDKFEEFKAKNNMEGMAQMEDMMEAIKMNSVLHLPRPAKKVEGPKAKLSADKKTITINATLKELMDNPKATDYHIEY